MIWLWILGILILLAVLIARTRIGAQVRFGDGPTSAVLRLGPFRIPLTGEEEKTPAKKEKTEKKTEKAAKKKKSSPSRGTFPKVTAADVKEAAAALWPPLKKALGRIRRGIRVDPMTVSVTIGAADDPAAGAETYGMAHGLVWTVMPALEKLIEIPDPGIHVGLDFESSVTRVRGEIGVKARIGTLIAVALQVGLPVLGWLSDWKKKHQADPPKQAEKTAAPSDAA